MRALLAVAAGVFAALLATEALLRLLPVSTATMRDYHFDPDLLTYPAHHEWTFSTGWDLRNPQRLRSNNVGFAAERDFVHDPSALALVGDSYVESAMLDAQDRPAPQLERALGGRTVYALGSPGSSLLDYAQRIRFAEQRYGISDFVVWLERGDARQVQCGSGNVHSRCLDRQTLATRTERMPPPSWVKRVLRESALAQYFAGQLKFDAGHLVERMLTWQPPAVPEARAEAVPTPRRVLAAEVVARERAIIDAAVDEFFRIARPHLRGRTVFIVDGQRHGHPLPPDADPFQRAHLITRLLAHGVEVVDLEPHYRRHGERSALSVEVGPHDAHLNRVGVAIAMGAVAEQWARPIRGQPAGPSLSRPPKGFEER